MKQKEKEREMTHEISDRNVTLHDLEEMEKRITDRINNVHDVTIDIRDTVDTTQSSIAETLAAVLDTKDVLKKVKRGVKRLERTWYQSPYAMIIFFCIVVLVVLVIFKSVT
jgi:t-SNARE complex subunit (syntaxin)